MFLFSKNFKSDSNARIAGSVETEGANLKRRNGLRARSVPTRNGKRTRAHPSSSVSSESETFAAIHVSSALSRNRSNSCTALDWFSGSMDWRAVVCSGAVEPTESNIGATEPILDIRHSCVKSESPTVVHQSRPHSLTPQSAEVVLSDDIVVPPELLSYHMAVADVASPGTTNLEQLDLLQGSSNRRRPLLSVDIPSGELSASAGMF